MHHAVPSDADSVERMFDGTQFRLGGKAAVVEPSCDGMAKGALLGTVFGGVDEISRDVT